MSRLSMGGQPVRPQFIVLPCLIILILAVTGCPEPPGSDPGRQEPLVVDTIGTNPESHAPDIQAFSEIEVWTDPCGGTLNVTGRTLGMSPGLLTSTAHFVLVFDTAWSKTSDYKPDMNSMRSAFLCYIDNLMISGDRLSVIPYAYATEGRLDKASWYSEVPLPDHRERVLGDNFPGDPMLGSWSWDWAMMDVLDHLIGTDGLENPNIIITMSASGSSGGEVEEEIEPPNGLEKYIERFTGGVSEVETFVFSYQSSTISENKFEAGEYTIDILMNEAAAELETDLQWPNVNIRLDNEGTIHSGDLVTMILEMPERLEQAVLTGQAKVLWNSGGPVTGDQVPDGGKVKWVYHTAGGFTVKAAVVWSDGTQTCMLSDEINITIESGSSPPAE